jgi:hypothetical protein
MIFAPLAPPKRGEGGGEGFLAGKIIGLLTPALSSKKGGEGENKNHVKMPDDFLPWPKLLLLACGSGDKLRACCKPLPHRRPPFRLPPGRI